MLAVAEKELFKLYQLFLRKAVGGQKKQIALLFFLIVRAGGSHYINMLAVDGKECCYGCLLIVVLVVFVVFLLGSVV